MFMTNLIVIEYKLKENTKWSFHIFQILITLIKYNAFGIVIPSFSESQIDNGNDIPSISSGIILITNRRNRCTSFIENM